MIPVSTRNMRRTRLFSSHGNLLDLRILAPLVLCGISVIIVADRTPLEPAHGEIGRAGSHRAGTSADRMRSSSAKSGLRFVPTQRRIVSRFAALPLSFEANQGQVAKRVKFLARGNGYALFLTNTEAVLSLRPPAHPQGSAAAYEPFIGQSATGNPSSTVVRISLVGANRTPRIRVFGELPGKSNYFIGNDRSRGLTNIPSYSKVQYENIYPGVDLVYYGSQGELEYDCVVAPRADPKLITFDLKGAREVSLDTAGNLVARIEGGEILLRRPHAYQESGGRREVVPAAYVLKGRDRIGFRVASYDRRRALVIDPVLSYATYLGGSGGDQGNDIAVDASGNAYVTGSTASTDFPTTTGVYQSALSGNGDAFVAKLDPAGSALVYCTYLGGRGEDSGNSIAVDSSGNAYIGGRTGSTDFPTTAGVFQAALKGTSDAFVTKLNADGSALVYSTYLGGTSADYGGSIAVDTSGSTYVTGVTFSGDFPVTPGVFQPTFASVTGVADAFITNLSPDGSTLVYSSFLGGTGSDQTSGVAVDGAGNAYLTGSTNSTNFPTVAPLQSTPGGGTDAFVAKVNADGSALVFSTYLGGSGDDQGFAIALDTSGNAYVTGSTASANFPTVGPFQNALSGGVDAFVSKLQGDGPALVYSTFLGGSGNDVGTSIAVDSSGNAYVTGQTASADFPKVNPVQAESALSDAFVAELDSTGAAMPFSSYLGGAGNELAYGISLDASGGIYLTGITYSRDFPTTIGAFQATYSKPLLGTVAKAFVAKISPANAPGFSLTSTSLTFSDQSVGTISIPQVVKLRNMGSAPLNIASIAVSGDFAQINTCGSLVLGGASCTLSVTFSPIARGSRTGIIVISDDAAGSPQTISLAGKGISPVVTLSSSSLTFSPGPLNTTSPAQTVTLTNTGLDPLTINGIIASGDFAESNSCGSSVAASANCTISVTFTATLAGTRNGLLTIVDNAAGSPHVVQLSGTGVGPNVKLSSRSLAFGDQPVGTTSGPQAITLTNDGNAPLSIAGVTISGSFAQTNNCVTSLEAGTSCGINVTFSPTSAGATFGAITITDNAPGNPHVINLSGTAVSGTAPVVFLSSASLAFGLQAVTTTSAPQTLTLSNTGNAELSVTKIATSGDFSQTNDCGNKVAAGARCTISITFTPKTAGVKAGAVTITDNAAGSPHLAGLSGTGTDFGMSASPPNATVDAGQSATYAITIVPVAGFNQALSLSCSGAPQAATCTVSPELVTPDGTSPVSTQVTVATKARSAVLPRGNGPRVGLPPVEGPLGLYWLFILAAFAFLTAVMTSRLGVRRMWLVPVVLLLVLLWGACNVGSQRITGTPPGGYALTITATTSATGGALSHQIQVGLTVN